MPAAVPPRWPTSGDDIQELRQTFVEAQREAGQRRSPALMYLVLGIGALAVGFLVDRSGAAAGKTSVPFSRSTVISESSAGLGARPDDFEYRLASAPEATPASTPTPEPTRRATRTKPRPDTRPRDPVDTLQPTEVLVSEEELAAALAEAPAEPAERPLTLNIGTRFPVRLLTAATTGAAAGVCSAETAADITVDGMVAIPHGTRLEGLAFATRENDRAQIVFRALVLDGKTIPLQAVVIGTDGDLGVKGKVIRKASRLKNLAGRVGGAVADAAMWSGVGGAEYGVADQLLSGAARDMNVLEQQWTRSDKVIRVQAGTQAEVYLRGDVVVVAR